MDCSTAFIKLGVDVGGTLVLLFFALCFCGLGGGLVGARFGVVGRAATVAEDAARCCHVAGRLAKERATPLVKPNMGEPSSSDVDQSFEPEKREKEDELGCLHSRHVDTTSFNLEAAV